MAMSFAAVEAEQPRVGVQNMLILARWNGQLKQLHSLYTGLERDVGKLGLFRLADNLSIESTGESTTVTEEQTAMAFSMDGSMFATAGKDGDLRVFGWPSLELIMREQCAIGLAEFKCIAFSEEGTLLAACTSAGRTYLWELHGVNHNLRVIHSEGGLYCWFSRGSTPQLHVASNEGYISGAQTGKENRRATRDSVHESRPISVSSDGELYAVGCSCCDVLIVEASTLKIVQRVKFKSWFAISAVGFSKDNRYFLSTCSGGKGFSVCPISDRNGSRFRITFQMILVFVIIIFLVLFALR